MLYVGKKSTVFVSALLNFSDLKVSPNSHSVVQHVESVRAEYSMCA